MVPRWKSKRKIFRNQAIRQINAQGESPSGRGLEGQGGSGLVWMDFDKLPHFVLFPSYSTRDGATYCGSFLYPRRIPPLQNPVLITSENFHCSLFYVYIFLYAIHMLA